MNGEELEYEPVPGLPSELPPGEHIVWQGRPQWRALAREGLKLRWLAAYFGLFMVARAAAVAVGGDWSSGGVQLLVMLLVFSACLGLCALIAWLHARTTMYTITTHRVVMRIGVALPITWNLPFERIAAADLVVRDEHDGDVVLRLVAPDRLAWFHIWPHARAGRMLRACPTLRAVSDPAGVAGRLQAAVRGWSSDVSATALAS